MKNGLIIFLIILLVIIIGGLIAFLVLCLNGNINLKSGFLHWGGKKSENLIYEQTYNIDDIKLINVKQDAGDVIFENNTDNNIKVEVYGENKSDVEVSLNNGELYVNYVGENNHVWIFNFGNTYGDIKIYVPSSYAEKIKINNDAGEVKIKNLEKAEADIDCDAGNVEIDRIKNATIKCDAGNVKIDYILNKCNIKVDAGNLRINNVQLAEDSNIKASMGNVRIKNTSGIHVEGHVSMGKCRINNNNVNSSVKLYIEANMGNIEVN